MRLEIIPLERDGFGICCDGFDMPLVLVKHDPEHLTQEFHKVDRGRRVLMDTGRNHYSATFAAAYTVRARPGATVSAPCTWTEVERGLVTPKSFTIRNMKERIANVGDLWKDAKPCALEPAIARLRKLSS